jgi:hypothetical protein
MKTKDQIIDEALCIYGCEDIQIDADPEVREGTDGTWVAAWVFVSKETDE